MSTKTAFTKGNLDNCLRQLAKEFRRLNGTHLSAEIILIGGAAVLVNYGFRDMTYDIDAIIHASGSIKDAINHVGDEMGLPNGWLNSDFIRTKSYSPKLIQYSKHYKNFYDILEIRTISGEYLIAMKLMSCRQYKNDISDIIGILYEEQKQGKSLTINQIKKATQNLYGNWEQLPKNSRKLITEILQNNQLEYLYEEYRTNERIAREALINFDRKYPGVTNADNINSIIEGLKQRKANDQ